MKVASDLNPEALRRPQSKNKVCSDKEFVEAVFPPGQAKNFSRVMEEAKAQLDMSPATAKRYLSRLKEAGLISTSGGLYWAGNQEVNAR
jgi:DNA-binding transcriptional ArsR family regulator